MTIITVNLNYYSLKLKAIVSSLVHDPVQIVIVMNHLNTEINIF